MITADFEARLWNADNTGYRILPLESVIPDVSARITASEGYAEATLPLYGKPSDTEGLARRRRVEFYARYHHDVSGVLTTERLYRGYIKRILPGKERSGKRTTLVRLFGIWSWASDQRCEKRYGKTLDRGSVFGDLARRFVLGNLFVPVVVEGAQVGETIDALDAWGKRFADAAESLSQGLGRIATGCDVDAFGQDRLYFRAFADLTDPATAVHVLSFPSPRSGEGKSEEDATQQATVLHLKGGTRRYPNMLAEATGGNTSFEYPIRSGAGVGNLLLNPGFEAQTGSTINHWTLGGGASRKQRGSDAEANPRSGDWMVELDAVGEEIEQGVAPGDITAGRNYSVLIHARRESGATAVVLEGRLHWRDAGNVVISTLTFPVEPTSANFDPFTGTQKAPVGAVSAIAEIVHISGGGAYIDDAEVFDTDLQYQQGVQVEAQGTATIVTQDLAYEGDAYHGAYSLYLDVTASDLDNNDVLIFPRTLATFEVAGGQNVRFFVWVKTPPGGSSPAFLLQVRDYNSEGVLLGSTQGARLPDASLVSLVPAGSVPNAWTCYWWDHLMGATAIRATVVKALRGNGQALIDAWGAMDVAAGTPTDPGYFAEGDTFEATSRADELFPPGDILDEAVAAGDIEAEETRQEITSAADGEAYATAYFERYTLPLSRVEGEQFGIVDTGIGSTATMWPGEAVRALGDDGAELLPAPLPVAEKLIKWDGKLTITPFPGTAPRDPAQVITQILRRELRRLGQI